MASGIWTSVSGAAAQAQNVDMVANNLANSDTLGFKKDAPAFREYLSTLEREHSPQDIPRGAIKDKDFYPLDGKDQAFVVVDGTYTNFRQGNLRVTQNPLDVALDGNGFFEISTPQGTRYTRQGSLHVSGDGRLETMDGFPVLASQPGGLSAPPTASPTSPLGQGRPATPLTQGRVPASEGGNDAARFINLRDRGHHFTINSQGDIYAGDELIAKLSVVEFSDTRKLRKTGNNAFENPDAGNYSAQPPKTIVRQGVLETSNVNPIEEMTKLISANRLFEHDLKAMKTYGEMMQREANDIGKL